MSEKSLLLIDAVINLLLGLLLGIFPRKIVAILGLPMVQNTFYASILGAVIFGIGVALLLEMSREKTGLGGLGLGGAIVINISGGFVLALWLVFGALDIPTRGFIVMWLLVAVLFAISAIELTAWKSRRHDIQ